MSDTATESRSVVVERDLPYPPARIWRALTEPHLIAEWLMQTDFAPSVDHRFTLEADWGTVECRVIEVEPERTLAYRWDSLGLQSVVTWTLEPMGAGTRLRMEQAGFRPEQEPAYQGARLGWRRFFGRLEEVVAREG